MISSHITFFFLGNDSCVICQILDSFSGIVFVYVSGLSA